MNEIHMDVPELYGECAVEWIRIENNIDVYIKKNGMCYLVELKRGRVTGATIHEEKVEIEINWVHDEIAYICV